MFLAQTVEPPKRPPTPQQREAVRQGATLTIISVLAVLLIGAFALVLLARYRRAYIDRMFSRRKRRRRTARGDAWSEAAKRLRLRGEPPGADDDTVDIDPSDLSPDDIDDGPNSGGKR